MPSQDQPRDITVHAHTDAPPYQAAPADLQRASGVKDCAYHSAWEKNGASPILCMETMQASVLRLLARATGELLAQTFPNQDEAKQKMGAILEGASEALMYHKFLRSSVEAILRASSDHEVPMRRLDVALLQLLTESKTMATELGLNKEGEIRNLVAVMKHSCVEMVDNLLSKAAPAADSNGGIMSRVRGFLFGSAPKVRTVELPLTDGSFAKALLKRLSSEQGQARFGNSSAQIARAAGATPEPADELVSLSVMRLARKGAALEPLVDTFALSKGAIVEAYFDTLVEYALACGNRGRA